MGLACWAVDYEVSRSNCSLKVHRLLFEVFWGPYGSISGAFRKHFGGTWGLLRAFELAVATATSRLESDLGLTAIFPKAELHSLRVTELLL